MRRLALLAPALLLVAACGTPEEVSTDTLESEVSTQLEQQVGRAPESVDCPDPLPAEVGATVRCVFTAPNGTRVGLTIQAQETGDDGVRFGLVLDEATQPQP